jgi:hypothetical protein
VDAVGFMPKFQAKEAHHVRLFTQYIHTHLANLRPLPESQPHHGVGDPLT